MITKIFMCEIVYDRQSEPKDPTIIPGQNVNSRNDIINSPIQSIDNFINNLERMLESCKNDLEKNNKYRNSWQFVFDSVNETFSTNPFEYLIKTDYFVMFLITLTPLIIVYYYKKN